MKKVELFMQELFQARIDEEKRILANRVSYRKKFFEPGCRWDNREFTLEMIETERILSIEGLNSNILVVTEYKASVSDPSVQINKRRYHLQAFDDSFLISDVE